MLPTDAQGPSRQTAPQARGGAPDAERFREALKDSPVVVFSQDTDLRYTWVYNPLQQFQSVDWVGRTDEDPAGGGTPVIELKREVLRTGQSIDRELVIAVNGEQRHHQFHVEALRGPDGAIVGLTGSATDVTELRRVQQQIQYQQQQLRSVIDGMPGLVSCIDRDYRYRFVNAGYSRWLGIPVSDVEGKTIEEAFGANAFAELKPYLDKALAGEPCSFERSLECADRARYVRVTYAPQAGTDGTIEGLIALVYDITEQKHAQDAREESDAQFRRIVELASEGIWIIDNDTRTTFANRRMAELLGYEPEELLGRSSLDFIHPEDLDRGREGVETRKLGSSEPREYRFLRRDGGIVWLDFTGAPVRDNTGALTGVLAMCTDITERKLAQEQLRQTQKLESLGVLAGGIAHDFNNLLVGMLGNASLASDTIGLSSPAQPMLAGVISAAERAAKLTRQLLAYAGRDNRRSASLNLDTLVSDIVPLLHASIPRNVHLSLELMGTRVFIEGDEGQLQQIVMNLAINGAESILEGKPGVVRVATELREPTAEERRRAVIPLHANTARCVVLTVSDTGCGMDSATLARIFDPFFTTKFTGRGMGLSAVLGIIKAHSGTLTIDTAPGRGTTFRVFLREATSAPVAEPVVEAGPVRGTGLILVADDEIAVRSVAVRALELSGYDVIEVSDGVEAIEAIARHEAVEAVVLDLAMPNMTGDQAAPELRRLRPGIRILLSSGYPEQEARRRFTLTAPDGFLQKPYTGRSLIRAVRDVMTRDRDAVSSAAREC